MATLQTARTRTGATRRQTSGTVCRSARTIPSVSSWALETSVPPSGRSTCRWTSRPTSEAVVRSDAMSVSCPTGPERVRRTASATDLSSHTGTEQGLSAGSRDLSTRARRGGRRDVPLRDSSSDHRSLSRRPHGPPRRPADVAGTVNRLNGATQWSDFGPPGCQPLTATARPSGSYGFRAPQTATAVSAIVRSFARSCSHVT